MNYRVMNVGEPPLVLREPAGKVDGAGFVSCSEPGGTETRGETTRRGTKKMVDLTIPWDSRRPASSFRDGGYYADVTHRLLSNIFAPAAALIDRAGMLCYCSGPIDRYLKVPTRGADVSLVGIAREGLMGMLQRLIRQGTRGDVAKVLATARVKREGAMVQVRLSLFPVLDPKRSENLYLVCFADEEPVQEMGGDKRVTTESCIIPEGENEPAPPRGSM